MVSTLYQRYINVISTLYLSSNKLMSSKGNVWNDAKHVKANIQSGKVAGSYVDHKPTWTRTVGLMLSYTQMCAEGIKKLNSEMELKKIFDMQDAQDNNSDSPLSPRTGMRMSLGEQETVFTKPSAVAIEQLSYEPLCGNPTAVVAAPKPKYTINKYTINKYATNTLHNTSSMKHNVIDAHVREIEIGGDGDTDDTFCANSRFINWRFA